MKEKHLFSTAMVHICICPCPIGNDASGTYKVSESEVQLTSGASGLGADLNKVSGLHEFKIDRDILQFDSFGLASTKYKKIK